MDTTPALSGETAHIHRDGMTLNGEKPIAAPT